VMTRLLQENRQFAGVPAWIWDRRGFIVGRWQNADAFVGRRVPPQQLEQIKARSSGVAKGESPEGIALYYSYARSPVTGWTASVGAERGELDRAVRAGWIVGGTLMVGGVLLGLLLALSIAARLRRSIVSLAAAASRNEPPQAVGLRTREIELLDVSRVTHGKITLRLEPTDLARVVARAIETATPALEAKRLRLTHELAPGPLMVRGDAARLLQVFSNLLDNATKFTPSGGEVGVTLASEDARALAVVSDNGVGIDAAFLPKMFEAFTQADTSLERATSGLGLGLALARQIVEAHGGSISATSAGRGQGSRLTVRLPLLV